MSFQLVTAISLGSSKTGLILNCSLFDYTNTLIASGISANFYEKGNGNYLFNYSNYPDNFIGIGVIHASGSYPGGTNVLAEFGLNPSENENSDVKTSTVGNTTVGANQITFTTVDQFSVPLPYVTLELYPSGVGNIISKINTSIATSSVVFNLDNGSYRVYSYNPGVSSFSNPYFFAVNGNASVSLTGTRFVVDPPANGTTCRIYAYTSDLGLNMVGGVEMFVKPSGYSNTTGGFVITRTPLTAVSDQNGFIFIDTLAGSVAIKVEIPRANFVRYLIPTSGQLNVATL